MLVQTYLCFIDLKANLALKKKQYMEDNKERIERNNAEMKQRLKEAVAKGEYKVCSFATQVLSVPFRRNWRQE